VKSTTSWWQTESVNVVFLELRLLPSVTRREVCTKKKERKKRKKERNDQIIFVFFLVSNVKRGLLFEKLWCEIGFWFLEYKRELGSLSDCEGFLGLRRDELWIWMRQSK